LGKKELKERRVRRIKLKFLKKGCTIKKYFVEKPNKLIKRSCVVLELNILEQGEAL